MPGIALPDAGSVVAGLGSKACLSVTMNQPADKVMQIIATPSPHPRRRFCLSLIREAASAAVRVNQNDGFPSGASVIQVDPCAAPRLELMRARPHKDAMKRSSRKRRQHMTDNISKAKKRPDFIAYAARSRGKNQPIALIRIGVGFSLKNDGVSVLYDALPLSGQIALVPIETDELPDFLPEAHEAVNPDFEASMVRDNGNDSYWTKVGAAWRVSGCIITYLEVMPTSGKIILTVPKDRQ